MTLYEGERWIPPPSPSVSGQVHSVEVGYDEVEESYIINTPPPPVSEQVHRVEEGDDVAEEEEEDDDLYTDQEVVLNFDI